MYLRISSQYHQFSFFNIEHTCYVSKGGAVLSALASCQCGQVWNPYIDAICGLSLFLVLFFAP